jgi:hypothetical protein
LVFPTSEGHVPHLNHLTCIAHGLRRICESIRENYNSVNDFIAALKKILIKAPMGLFNVVDEYFSEDAGNR